MQIESTDLLTVWLSCIPLQVILPLLPALRPCILAKSEQLVLQSHVRLGLKTDASTEDIGQCAALFSKGIDHWGTRRGQRRLYSSA